MNRHHSKQDRAARAQVWVASMERDHADEIQSSTARSIIYDTIVDSVQDCDPADTQTTEIILDDIDSVSAVCKYARQGENTALLNFASFKNPGGGFIWGAMAQEECLCAESFLYSVLAKRMDYYLWNREHLNNGLYLNRAIYSPDIHFYHDGQDAACDVITCASPNWNAAKYTNATYEENLRALESRIRFILDIAADNQIDNLILGAFGCGVFDQDPAIVAENFAAMTKDYAFRRIVYAIPDRTCRNYRIFEQIFGN